MTFATITAPLRAGTACMLLGMSGVLAAQEAAKAPNDLAKTAQIFGSRETVRDISLSVLEPIFGRKPRRRTIYIGTENTYTKQRFKAALARAIELRQAAEAKYQLAETRAKRAASREFRAGLVK